MEQPLAFCVTLPLLYGIGSVETRSYICCHTYITFRPMKGKITLIIILVAVVGNIRCFTTFAIGFYWIGNLEPHVYIYILIFCL